MLKLRTVICHFYNEEYLLPWWLKHHREIFDYGIMIDNGSRDGSVDICRDLVPHWRIVRGRNHELNAVQQDFEVMQYESELPGWKIALNATEFLFAPHLDLLEKEILDERTLQGGCHGSMIDGYMMIDPHPADTPSHSLPLFVQKPFGFRQKDVPGPHHFGQNRSRFYHRMQIGCYAPGRHETRWPRLAASPDSREWAMILWFVLSPWNTQFIARKLQIGATLSQIDRGIGFGIQHQFDLDRMEDERQKYLRFTTDLSQRLQLQRPQPVLRNPTL